MSSPRATDVRAAAEGDYDRISPRRLGSYLKGGSLLQPRSLLRLTEDVNGGVFGGHGRAAHADAMNLIAQTTAHVIYLDPPYAGTTGYSHEYAVLDELLGGDAPTGTPPSLADFVSASAHIPTLILSYGGPRTDLESLVATVGEDRTVERSLAIPYRHLGAIASEEKNATNKEFLIIATR
jgi:hypothetical protein